MGDYSLKITGRTKAWYSPAKNIYSIIRQNGAGKYTISMKVLTTAVTPEAPIIGTLIRTQTENSFSTDHSGNYFYRLAGKYSGVTANNWFTLSGTVDILDSDISAETGLFRLMFDHLDPVDGQAVYIDDIRIEKYSEPDDFEIDKTSGYLYIGETMKINTNKEYGIGFYSSNKNVATVNNKGEVTAVSAGQTTIHVTRGSQKRYCTVTVDPKYHDLDNGRYYFQNVQHEIYMQVDQSDADNGYNTNKANVSSWGYDGETYQKWTLYYVGEGYYKICNLKSGLVLSVQASKVNSNNSAIVQENYQGLDRQLWQIIRLPDGYYKLKPKSSEKYSSDWCAAAGSGRGEPYGKNVEQRKFIDDSERYDEWRLFFLDGKDFVGIAIENDNADRHSIYKSVFYNMSFTEFNDYNFINTAWMTKELYLNKLDNAKILVSRSHGNGDSQYTCIYLGNDEFVYPSDLSALDLSNLDLVLYIACKTAANRDIETSLIDKSVQQGAECAVGFKETIYRTYTNEWTRKFFASYAKGKSIEQACSDASEGMPESAGVYSFQIARKGV